MCVCVQHMFATYVFQQQQQQEQQKVPKSNWIDSLPQIMRKEVHKTKNNNKKNNTQNKHNEMSKLFLLLVSFALK